MQFPLMHHPGNVTTVLDRHGNFPAIRLHMSLIEIPTYLRFSLADSDSVLSLASKSRRKNSLVAKDLVDQTAAGNFIKIYKRIFEYLHRYSILVKHM